MSSFLSKKNMSLYSQISIKLHGCCCIAASLIFFLYGRVMQLQKKQTSVSAEKVPNQKKNNQSSLLDLNQRLNTHLIQLEPTKTTWRGPPTMPHSTSTYQVRLVPKVDDGCFHWWGQIRCEFQGGNQGDLEKFQWDQNDLWKTQKKREMVSTSYTKHYLDGLETPTVPTTRVTTPQESLIWNPTIGFREQENPENPLEVSLKNHTKEVNQGKKYGKQKGHPTIPGVSIASTTSMRSYLFTSIISTRHTQSYRAVLILLVNYFHLNLITDFQRPVTHHPNPPTGALLKDQPRGDHPNVQLQPSNHQWFLWH